MSGTSDQVHLPVAPTTSTRVVGACGVAKSPGADPTSAKPISSSVREPSGEASWVNCVQTSSNIRLCAQSLRVGSYQDCKLDT